MEIEESQDGACAAYYKCTAAVQAQVCPLHVHRACAPCLLLTQALEVASRLVDNAAAVRGQRVGMRDGLGAKVAARRAREAELLGSTVRAPPLLRTHAAHAAHAHAHA